MTEFVHGGAEEGIKILNSMAIHLYKTSTPSTHNGVVGKQVEANA